MEKWWDNAKDWVKVLICIVVSIVSIAANHSYDDYANCLEHQTA